MKQPPTAIVSLYRIAPGKHLDFLKWMAEAAAVNKEAGVVVDFADPAAPHSDRTVTLERGAVALDPDA